MANNTIESLRKKVKKLNKELKEYEEGYSMTPQSSRPGNNIKKLPCSDVNCSRMLENNNNLAIHVFYDHKASVCPVCQHHNNSFKALKDLACEGDFLCAECGSSYRKHYKAWISRKVKRQ